MSGWCRSSATTDRSPSLQNEQGRILLEAALFIETIYNKYMKLSQAEQALSKLDPDMAALIRRNGPIVREPRTDFSPHWLVRLSPSKYRSKRRRLFLVDSKRQPTWTPHASLR